MVTRLETAAGTAGKRRRSRNYDAGSDIEDLTNYLLEYMGPVGTVIVKLSINTPGDAWVLAAGQALSKVDYADLYADIGGAFGENATTFNIPDFTGRKIAGIDVHRFIKTRL